MATKRSASPAVAMVREFLLGRQWNGQLRFPGDISTRSPPPPNLPPGPACKLSDNYYYTRDARREVDYPKVIVDGTVPLKQIADASKGDAEKKLEQLVTVQTDPIGEKAPDTWHKVLALKKIQGSKYFVHV